MPTDPPTGSSQANFIVIPLSHKIRPSAWDIVLQDEPLEPPKERWSTPLVSTNEVVTLTISSVMGSNMMPGTVLTTTSGLQYRTVDSRRHKHHGSLSMGTMVGQEICQDCTAAHGGNEPLSLEPIRPPYSRNRHEKRTLQTLSLSRLETLARQIDQLFEGQDRVTDTEWNNAFWKAVTPVRTENASHHRATGWSR